jgi:hypothetical protein
MAKDMGSFRDLHAHSWLSGTWTGVPTKPLCNRPWTYDLYLVDEFKINLLRVRLLQIV